jgi:hypothetical protein
VDEGQSAKPLRSFQAKLLWAHQHMDALRKDIVTFGFSEPCVIAHDFEPDGLKHTWRVCGKVDTPPQQLSLRLADTLNNWRSALDHLAFDLARSSGQTPKSCTAFPIYRDPDVFASEHVQRQMKGMTEQMRAIIEGLQPYPGSSSHVTNYHLGLLNSLGNVEKHRHFNLIAVSVDLATFSVDGSDLSDSFIHQGPVENGTILARAKGLEDVRFIPAFGIAFGKGGEASGELVHELVLRIELAVQDAVGELSYFVL